MTVRQQAISAQHSARQARDAASTPYERHMAEAVLHLAEALQKVPSEVNSD